MRKGISLSIETIIVLMLALVVLVVLLGMLFNVAPPVQNDLQARTKQIQACGAYTNYDGDCSLGTDYTTFKSSNSAVLKDIAVACSTLRVSGCSAGSEATESCIRACCLGCNSGKCSDLGGQCKSHSCDGFTPPMKQMNGDCSGSGQDYVCCK